MGYVATEPMILQYNSTQERKEMNRVEGVQVLYNDGAKKQLRNKRTRGGSQIKVAYGTEGSGRGGIMNSSLVQCSKTISTMEVSGLNACLLLMS